GITALQFVLPSASWKFMRSVMRAAAAVILPLLTAGWAADVRALDHSAPDGEKPAVVTVAVASAAADTAGLRRALERITSPFAGIVGISVRNLATGEQLSIRGGEKYPSASLIKV